VPLYDGTRLGDEGLVAAIRRLKLMIFDFDGVMTDNGVYVLDDGREFVRASRMDGLGLAKLKRLGIELMILSTETNPVVGHRARKLEIPCLQGVADKKGALGRLVQERGHDLSEVGFLGNDTNDLGCLGLVGLPMVVFDSHPDVLDAAVYRTQTRGGFGAVREVCDLIAEVRRQEPA
jgi:3-deoxy-D-manno-octulosonate 8-phosphate phosphatase (KDO 8-P phosphatase)